jgi:hypothetical protein
MKDDLNLFRAVLADWNEQIRIMTCRDIEYVLMNATTSGEINSIVWDNLDFLNDNIKLFRNVNDARKRINRLRKFKFDNCEMIYLN